MEGNKISLRALDPDDDRGLKTMADSHQPINFEEALKPFYQRASEAEVLHSFILYPPLFLL